MSAPRRFFADIEEGMSEAELSGEEFVHAKNVLRVEVGSEIILLDGKGKEFSAIVTNINKHSLSAHITGAICESREPKTQIFLLCGLLKGDKTELVVQKATELGVSKIGVFSSEYCAAYMNDNKLERLNKVAREAAKQCLRSLAPDVVYYKDLKSALDAAKDYQNKFFACEFLDKSERRIENLKGPVALVSGSEGGFSEREYALAKEAGFDGLWLGRRILRGETAAIALSVLAANALGELG